MRGTHLDVPCHLVPRTIARQSVSQTKIRASHKTCYHIRGCMGFNPSDLCERQRHVKTSAIVTKVGTRVHLDASDKFAN